MITDISEINSIVDILIRISSHIFITSSSHKYRVYQNS